MFTILDERKSIVLDTSILMDDYTSIEKALSLYNEVIINITTVEELDNLKTSKDLLKSKSARKALEYLYYNGSSITYDLTKDVVPELSLDYTLNRYNPNDNIIISCAIRTNSDIATEDFAFRIKCNALNVKCVSLKEKGIPYTGYKEVNLSEEEMASLYSDMECNSFGCLTNQYLIVNNDVGENVDVLKWNGEKFVNLYNKSIKTTAFGESLKPKDIYQKCVVDSIMTNPMTAISGVAGSGKSLLSLMCAMKLVESDKYSRIVILNNPTKAKGATDCGYYTGSMTEKLMQNSIGNILNTKFGDRFAVDLLIQQDKLRIISMADARGMEIRDDEILYITECQNTSVELLKLSLSRASQNAKIIIEGDIYTQVDSIEFVGDKNGMKRAIDVFKGSDMFGFVELKNVWRSRIAEMCERM